MAHDVFISSSTGDRSLAETLYAAIEAEGITCWMSPRDVPYGGRRKEQVRGAVVAARAMLLVFSAEANRSGFVENEAHLAKSSGLPIIVVASEQEPLSLGLRFALSSCHWIPAPDGATQAVVGRVIGALRSLSDLKQPRTRRAPVDVSPFLKRAKLGGSSPQRTQSDLVRKRTAVTESATKGHSSQLFEGPPPELLEQTQLESTGERSDPPTPYDGEQPFVFVTYKREDMPRIATYLHDLAGLGYNFWYDKAINAGAEWAALIEEKVLGCSALVVFLSQAAVDSKWCRREIRFADSKNKPIIAIRLEDVELHSGLDLVLSQYQMIDARAESFDQELKRAIKFVRLL